MTGRARVFTRERDVIAALKGQEGEPVVEGEVIVLAGRGPLGSGHGGDLPGDVVPALPADGPRHRPRHRRAVLGRLDRAVHRARQPGGARGRADRQARRRRPRPDRRRHAEPARRRSSSSATATRRGRRRRRRPCSRNVRRTRRSRPDDALPADTALWARLQSVSGGLWGGCVYDVESIVAALGAGAVDTPATDNRLSGSLS